MIFVNLEPRSPVVLTIMNLTTDIKFLPDSNRYLLVLPGQLTNVLDLNDDEGKAIPITHENKMQLEWLSQRLLSLFGKVNETLVANRATLKRKKYWAVSIIFLSVLAAVFNQELARLAHTQVFYIEVTAFAVGAISCLQLFKYFAMGFTDLGRDSFSDVQFAEIKELIRKDYLQ
jgi:hypothetical protein